MKSKLLVFLFLLAALSANTQINTLAYGTGLTAIRSCNLIQNSSFENCSAPSCRGRKWGPFFNELKRVTINNWTASGGGTLTYAAMEDNFNPENPPPPDGKLMLYFGNDNVHVSQLPSIDITTGEVTFSPGLTIKHSSEGHGNDNEGISIEQNVPVIAGHLFLLDFWVSGEFIRSVGPPADGEDQNGFMQLTITDGAGIYSKYLAVPGYYSNGLTTAGKPFMRYYVTFKANTNAVKVKFTNYGHIHSTNEQPDYESTELLLDDVILNDLTLLADAVPVLQLKKENSRVILSWTAPGRDETVKRYEVERSKDGMHFTTIGALDSKGSEKSFYRYTDESAIEDQLYYRLKIVDITGETRYSRVVFRNQAGSDNPYVLNSVVNNVIEMHNVPKGITTMRLINTSGVAIGEKQYKNTATGTVQMDIQHLSAGMYMLQVFNKEKSWIYRVIKQ